MVPRDAGSGGGIQQGLIDVEGRKAPSVSAGPSGTLSYAERDAASGGGGGGGW